MKWQPQYAIGIEIIDSQHQELFSRLQQLIDAIADGNEKTQVIETIAFLKEYTLLHFSYEESLMEQAGYPGLAAHRKQHGEFAADVSEFESFAQSGSYAVGLAVIIVEHLVEWLYKHILRTDRIMGEYIITYGTADDDKDD